MTRATALIGWVVLALTACRSASMNGVGDRPDEQPGTAESVPGPVRVELLMPPRLRAAAPVPIRLRVQNVSRQAVDLYLRGRGITFDVVVARASGEIVWQRLEREMIPAIVHLRPLEPGERLESETIWNQITKTGQTAEPGAYVVHALLLVEGQPLTTPSVPLRILGRNE
jgi:hypothetical protein